MVHIRIPTAMVFDRNAKDVMIIKSAPFDVIGERYRDVVHLLNQKQMMSVEMQISI